MNYQQLLISLHAQLSRLIEDRGTALQCIATEAKREAAFAFGHSESAGELSKAHRELERINTQLAELASALGAVARAASSWNQ